MRKSLIQEILKENFLLKISPKEKFCFRTNERMRKSLIQEILKENFLLKISPKEKFCFRTNERLLVRKAHSNE
jgi:hypothetical protein